MSGEDPFWKFLGLQIARKTEILALAAFVLSVSGIFWQIFNYARGSVVRLFPSDLVVITSTDKLGRSYSERENFAAFIVPMAYVNEGDTGHNAIIRREYVEVSLGDRHVEHRWYQFGSSDIQDADLTFRRDSEARPFLINAGSAVSHETVFSAWEIDCDQTAQPCDPYGNAVKWADFLKTIQTTKQLSFVASADVYPSKRVSATCVVRLRDTEISTLNQMQWVSAACVDPSISSPTQRRRETGQTRPAVQK